MKKYNKIYIPLLLMIAAMFLGSGLMAQNIPDNDREGWVLMDNTSHVFEIKFDRDGMVGYKDLQPEIYTLGNHASMGIYKENSSNGKKELQAFLIHNRLYQAENDVYGVQYDSVSGINGYMDGFVSYFPKVNTEDEYYIFWVKLMLHHSLYCSTVEINNQTIDQKSTEYYGGNWCPGYCYWKESDDEYNVDALHGMSEYTNKNLSQISSTNGFIPQNEVLIDSIFHHYATELDRITGLEGARYYGAIYTDSLYSIYDHFQLLNYETEETYSFLIDPDSTGTLGINDFIFSAPQKESAFFVMSDGSVWEYGFDGTNLGEITTPEQRVFDKTEIRRAPDGNIYLVTNDGTQFGKIDKHNLSAIEIIDIPGLPSGRRLDICFTDSDGNPKTYILPRNFDFPMSVSSSVIQPSCSIAGTTEGSITIGVIGGFPDYTFSWTGPNGFTATTQNLTNLTDEGTYTLTVTDSQGNEYVEQFFIEFQLVYSKNEWVVIDQDYNPGIYDDQDISFKKGIRVTEGYSLEIRNDCNFEFGPQAKIIIEKGAMLKVDSSTLTNFWHCNDEMWQGIIVEGTDGPQTLANQGFLKIINNSNIENARKAIQVNTYGGSYWDNGGIVKATNSNFRNNRIDFSFSPYLDEIAPGVYENNLSSFHSCTFSRDQAYLSPDNQGLVNGVLYGVKGVFFKDCRFINHFSWFPKAKAIFAYDAGFRIFGSNYENATFENYTTAIDILPTKKAVTVENISFQNNSTSIEMKEVDNAAILSNQFSLGNPIKCDEFHASTAFGIDMEACTGFAIEENYFTKKENNPLAIYVGIRVKDCPSVHDIIYKNTFSKLSYGNYAQGDNRQSDDDATGIEYRCNENSYNFTDFIVTGTNPSTDRINGSMGSVGLSAGNTFTDNITGIEGNFRNDGYQDITYFYKNVYPIERSPNVFINDAGTNYSCPSHYGGGSDKDLVLTVEQKQATIQNYYTNASDYESVVALYENLKDGGNTEALQTEVTLSWPNEMWELRAELLGKSPFLSKEVLMTAADKTDVLPESVLFEILSANPDELKKEELIKYLEDKENPLPDYMISILRQLAGGTTYKTILKSDMAKYHANKMQAAYKLIRSNLNDSITDYAELRSWLYELDNINADLQIVSTFMDEGDYTSAQSLLGIIPGYYNLEGEKLVDFNNTKSILEMQMTWQQEGRSVRELTETELNSLITLTESNGRAAVIAKAILEFSTDAEYCNCLPTVDEGAMKNSEAQAEEDMGDLDNGLTFSITPNPATTWVAFNYALPAYADKASLEITDMQGKLIAGIQLTGKIGQKVWDTRKVEKGVYLYTLKVGTLQKTGKIIIK